MVSGNELSMVSGNELSMVSGNELSRENQRMSMRNLGLEFL